VLGLDTGSPLVSVAVTCGERVLAERAVELHRSSERLIGLIDGVLAAAGVSPGALAGVVALRGPGSFTGLRVGLATALGLSQGLGCLAAATPTLLVLAAWARREHGTAACRAVVERVRGEWFCQELEFAPGARLPSPLGDVTTARSVDLSPGLPLVGFGAVGLAAAAGLDAIEAGPLAATAALLIGSGAFPWNAADLIRPLYLSVPATTTPRSSGTPRPDLP
jgi:tRNA threonylcarbamoyladenosine biosynthesis protein TsaB